MTQPSPALAASPFALPSSGAPAVSLQRSAGLTYRARPVRRQQFFSHQRLGLHQVAYIRALVQGLPPVEAARRYLAIERDNQAQRAHLETVELVCAIARRLGDARWRLIGVRIPDDSPLEPPAAPGAGQSALPTPEQWAAEKGYEDFGKEEIAYLYRERFGAELASVGAAVDPRERRRDARNSRLRQLRLDLIERLQATAVEAASRHDRLDGWFSLHIARKLESCGALTLGDLEARIRRGGRWWRGLKGIGEAKAEAIAAHLTLLLANAPATAAARERLATGALAEIRKEGAPKALGVAGANRVSPAPGAYRVVKAENDLDALELWISARCNSDKSRVSYRRELTRFRLWLWATRQSALSDATVDDCRAYMDFLAAVPEAWMSSAHASPGSSGWAPFRTQPSLASQQHAIKVIHSAFAWLTRNAYLGVNPWEALNRKLGDEDPEAAEDRGASADYDDPTSRAFTPSAWARLLDQAEADAREGKTAAGAHRMRWLLQFGEATGLRADELLRARRRSFGCRDGAWYLRVFGKGRKRRRVPIPNRVMALTRAYFASRGLDFDSCSGKAYLVGATSNATQEEAEAGVTYMALAASFKSFLLRAARRATEADASALRRASLHWLRHTHGTRSAERGLSATDIQSNLGQADTRTATLYTRAQLDRRTALLEGAFG